MNNRIRFLINALRDNTAYIDYITYDTDLTPETKNDTIIKITNIAINQALELQHLIKQENETFD